MLTAPWTPRRLLRSWTLASLILLVGFPASSAAAAAPAAHLTIHAQAVPTRFSSADNGRCLQSIGEGAVVPWCEGYQVTVVNSGSLPTSKPITLSDVLPAGVHVIPSGTQVLFLIGQNPEALPLEEHLPLEGEPLNAAELCHPKAASVSCEYSEPLPPDQRLEMKVFVTTDPGASAAPNAASVTEGGEQVASISEPDVIDSSPPAFGASQLLSEMTGADGAPDTQAGSHPYELVNRFDLNTRMAVNDNGQLQGISVQGVRDVVVDLPLGFFGSATATPERCTFAQLQSSPESCPRDTVVGRLGTEPSATASANSPVYNMVPEHGAAAEFGFRDLLYGTHVIVANVAPTPSGYVLRAVAREVPEIPLSAVVTTFFGTPAARNGSGATPAAMFTNPSDCSGQPLLTTFHMDSWPNPGPWSSDGVPNLEDPRWTAVTAESPPVTGCSLLRFQPEAFTVKPETSTADSPTGLSFELKVSQSQNPGTLATPPLRDASVTLPAGLTVDPSAASGLGACSEAQIGWLGTLGPHGEELANKGLTNFTAAPSSCPDASKVGSVEVLSPLLSTPLVGSVYLAAQDENPFHTLLAGYIVIDDPTTGTVVKIPGNLTPNPQTGQITGVFDENPQLPFSDLKIHFFGGSRGDLATPEGCGTYTTTSDFEPWSAPESGPDATPSDSFPINSGCVSGFAPAFSAGTVSPQAAAFSPFTLSFSRNDNEEGPAGLTVSLPTGLLGKIAGVSECSDAQVAAAAAHSGATEQSSPGCPANSQLGTVTTASGPGPNPFVVGGKAYLTGPYKGAPFGVAVVVPALAGPFDLGTVVIRQALYIDPNDAHATDVSDPFPTILQGIPLRIKSVNVTLDRPSFTFNPSSCEPKAITGAMTSIGGAHTPVSSRFQAAGCQNLPFKPVFTISTQGKTSKANGGSLNVKIAYPSSGEANIAKVDLQFPKALPARLTTLQKACTAAQFESNPAGCPAASDIATVVVHTPLLNVPLTGPAYFVSHGGAAFPDVELVLQGEGVELVVDGKTQIKKGVTFSHFDTTPDAPFSTFEFNAPEGPYSILTANGDLCTQTLLMPTTITGQNGAVINQDTKIGVTGCPKIKKATLTRAQKLAKALKACRKNRNKAKRAACERSARRRYSPVRKSKHGNKK